ncbi:hypothetical protein MNV49_001723 [Pseudohyphozyma bogoriensis]|nr:hypothetical protein MNV49_001723 [Pseudohyphozyma bogoriensis]
MATPADKEAVAAAAAADVSSDISTPELLDHSLPPSVTTTTPPSPSAPLPATDAHLPVDAPVLPLGAGVHPEDQAEHLEATPDHIVDAELEKVHAAHREHHGLEPQGTVFEGIEDDKLWALMRRFNTHTTHILSPPTKLPEGEPDFRRSDLPNLDFDHDVLMSNLERLYATAGVSGIYATREMMRLMSWSPEERNRTACFCAGYFISAYFSMAIPFIISILILLTVSPKSRTILFPPVKPPPGVPPSATDPTNRKGDESALVGVGHPVVHRSKAEQIEEQAWEFSSGLQSLGIRIVMGGHKGHKGNSRVGKKEGESSSDEEDSSSEDEVQAAGVDVMPKHEEDGKPLTPKQRRKLQAKEAKKKRDEMVARIAKGGQDALGDIADGCEIVHHMLSPPAVYPHYHARELFASAVLVPILLATAIVPAHWWAQGASFAFGFAFFGQPLIIRGTRKFMELVPNWQDLMNPRNSLLSRVPTNAQVAVYVLRSSEAAYEPLPPPPHAPTAKDLKEEMSKEGIPDGDEAIKDAEAAEEEENPDNTADQSVSGKVQKKGAKKLLGGLRLAAKKAATFRGDVTVENTRAKVGNKIDRTFYQSRAKDDNTLSSFPAKHNGTSGHLIINHRPGAVSTLSFVPLRHPNRETFNAPIASLVELRKEGVFIAPNVNLEGMGLSMRFKDHVERMMDTIGEGEDPHTEDHEGDMWSFSHVARRDQLFNRLIAIGGQKWETL